MPNHTKLSPPFNSSRALYLLRFPQFSLPSLCPVSPLLHVALPVAVSTQSCPDRLRISFLPGHPLFGEALECLVCVRLALLLFFYFINLGCFTSSQNEEEDLGEEKAGVHKGGADSDRDSSGSGSDP